MNYFATTALLNFFATGSLAVFVLFSNIKNRMNQTYALTYLSIALWALFYFFWQTSGKYSDAMLYLKLLMFAATFMPIFLFHFMLAYLNIERKYYRLLCALYLIGFVFILCIYNNLLFDTLTPKLGFPFWPDAGKVMNAYIAFFFGFIGYAMLMLYRSYVSSSGAIKTRIIYLIVGLGFAILAGSPNYFLWYNIPIPPILNPLFMVSVAIIGYAIMRYRLMDIEVAIKRGFIYSVLIASIMAIYSLGIFIASQLFQNVGISPWVLAIIGSVVIAAGFVPLYNYLTNITDKYFFRKKYEYQKTLLELSKGLNQLMPMDIFAKLLVRRVLRTIRLDGTAVAIFDGNENVFIVLDGQRQMANLNGQKLSPGDTFVRAIAERDYLLIDDVENQLKNKNLDSLALKKSKSISESARHLNVSLAVPAKFENKMVGILLMGEKLSQEQFSDEDITLFTTLSNQAAMAMANVKVYDEALKQFQAEHDKSESLQKQLDRSQRLASLGTIAAGVAHEIRNPLGILQLKSEELLSKVQDQQDANYYRRIFDDNISRVSSIISNMLNLTKTEKHEMKSLNLNQLIESTLQFFTISRIKLIKDFKDIPSISGNAEELRHVFVNLIENAIEAMPEGGELRLSTYQTEEDGKKVVCAEVADTGVGIPKNNLDKIFDPFFSTRHEGTGLGLSIVYRIVREHGGSIDVKSEVGKGSTFTLKFPQATN